MDVDRASKIFDAGESVKKRLRTAQSSDQLAVVHACIELAISDLEELRNSLPTGGDSYAIPRPDFPRPMGVQDAERRTVGIAPGPVLEAVTDGVLADLKADAEIAADRSR